MNVSDSYRTQQSGEGNVDCHQIGNGVDSYQCATNAWRTSRRHFLSAGQGCGEYELICFRDSDEHKESEKQCDEIQSLLHEHPLLLETLPLMVVEAKVCQTGKLTDTTGICFSTMQLPVSNLLRLLPHFRGEASVCGRESYSVCEFIHQPAFDCLSGSAR